MRDEGTADGDFCGVLHFPDPSASIVRWERVIDRNAKPLEFNGATPIGLYRFSDALGVDLVLAPGRVDDIES